MRELARGIFPAILADQGLGAALDAYVLRARLPVTVRMDRAALDSRYEPQAEAIVYFCVIQGLANVGKYALTAPFRFVSMPSRTVWSSRSSTTDRVLTCFDFMRVPTSWTCATQSRRWAASSVQAQGEVPEPPSTGGCRSPSLRSSEPVDHRVREICSGAPTKDVDAVATR